MRLSGSAHEIRKRGVARFDFSDPYHLAVTLSWPAFVITALLLLLTINLVFAGLYLLQPGAIQNLAPGDLADAAFFSLETLATVGYGEMAPATHYGHAVAAAEIVVGMAFTAILTGLLFVRFSRPKSKILFADQAVVARHNGRPTLMIRVANGRLTMLTGAHANLGVLLETVSDEGVAMRNVEPLPLIRADLSIFPLNWTLMHVIDETSPLDGFHRRDPTTRDLHLFLSIEARDTVTGADVYAAKEYGWDAIVAGSRYVDMVVGDAEGRIIADVTLLHAIEPDATPQM